MNDFNSFHPNLKFTYDSSKEIFVFLDLKVDLSNGHLETAMYVKPIDRHQYLHYTSSHPDHTKRSMVFSQILRISRLCSKREDFNSFCFQMKTWFRRRDYPEDLINTEMKKVKFSPPRKNANTKKSKGIPFVVTFHPLLKGLNKIIKKNMYILIMDNEVKGTFSSEPMVSFRSARKLSSFLVRAKLYALKRKVGYAKCKKNESKVCNHVNNTTSFSSSVTEENFKINHH